ncbi:MAG: hypothetical protein PVI40_03100 [Chlamydiota bacterium]|jgi:hypothetical protein
MAVSLPYVTFQLNQLPEEEKDRLEKECPICQDDVNDDDDASAHLMTSSFDSDRQISPHIYHKDCLDQWFIVQGTTINTCPSCRESIQKIATNLITKTTSSSAPKPSSSTSSKMPKKIALIGGIIAAGASLLPIFKLIQKVFLIASPAFAMISSIFVIFPLGVVTSFYAGAYLTENAVSYLMNRKSIPC